jgi:type 1 glutamine amidotransferase/sugar phosphate isomerase/epimerase
MMNHNMMNHKTISAALFVSLSWAIVALGQVPAPVPPARGAATPGRGATPPQGQGRAEWRTRTLSQSGSFLKWKVGAPADAFQGLSFLEAAVRLDVLGMAYIEGSNKQWVSPEVRKNLDYNLTVEEVAAIRDRLRRLHVEMVAYHVDTLGPDDAVRRKVLGFAKSLGAEMIISAPDPASLPAIDKLASEIGVNVAIENRSRKDTPAYWDPKGALAALQGRSNRIGVRADLGTWVQEGIKPQEGVSQLKERLMAVRVNDQTSVEARTQYLQEMSRLGLKPLFFTLNSTSAVDASSDLARSVDSFEEAVLPLLGAFLIQRSKTVPIHMPSELPADVRQRIEAALPRTAPAKPLKPRKLLVMDQHSWHAPVPHTNHALEVMGKTTGAYEVVFSNDLDNLKYDKIRQFDAVFLNSSELDLTSDPALREGLFRFVREGGGLGGFHGAIWSAAYSSEFMEMYSGSEGPHRIEKATWKFDDLDSPITRAFGGQPYTYTDEYYRMTDTGRYGKYYSREKVHVLFSIDMEKTPEFNSGRAPFIRKDDDYAVSWIKGYGKGRLFYCSLGHTPEMFFDPRINQFTLAAVQFILGDLPADTTPTAELQRKR